jgi:hypothetical protein
MRILRGGSGSLFLREGVAIKNDTEKEYEINYSYSTVANGDADRIAIAPGEVAVLHSLGGPRDFTIWKIYSVGEYPYYACPLSHQMGVFE